MEGRERAAIVGRSADEWLAAYGNYGTTFSPDVVLGLIRVARASANLRRATRAGSDSAEYGEWIEALRAAGLGEPDPGEHVCTFERCCR